MNDVLALLAEANPVQAHELAPLELPAVPRRRPSRRHVLAIAVVTAALAATLVGAFVIGGNHPASAPPQVHGAAGPTGWAGPITVAHPLAVGEKVTLAKAADAIGQPVVLPDTSLIGPGDVGPVWAWSHDTRGIVA